MTSQDDIERRTNELQRQAIIIDGHSDILIPVTEGKMDLGQRPEVPDPATWQPPMGLERHPFSQLGMGPHTVYFGPMGQYDILRFREGGLTAQVCAVYLDDHKLGDGLRHGLEMTWQLRRAAEQYPDFELVTSAAAIRRLKKQGKTGAILSFEGCEALGGNYLRVFEQVWGE